MRAQTGSVVKFLLLQLNNQDKPHRKEGGLVWLMVLEVHRPRLGNLLPFDETRGSNGRERERKGCLKSHREAGRKQGSLPMYVVSPSKITMTSSWEYHSSDQSNPVTSQGPHC